MNDLFRTAAFHVGEIDDDIDLTNPPMSSDDYIKRVIIEARNCDDIVVAKIDESKLKRPTLNITPLAGCIEAPESLSPSLEWQNYQVSDFSDVRLNFARVKAERQELRPMPLTSEKIPYTTDANGWINFCLGSKDESKSSNPPTLDIILGMNQPIVEKVLEYLVDEIDCKKYVSTNMGLWIYALLAAIELPLDPSVCSCLRTLARACSIARSKLTTNDSQQVATLNLLICLVARYFRQLDLADP